MLEVKVRRSELLKVLNDNRATHQQIFEEALAGYKVKAVEKLERALALAKAGERVLEEFYLPIPVNQTHEYNRAIRMMEMSVDEEIELTSQQFDAYVMDQWQWKHGFLTANAGYSGTATQELRKVQQS